MKNVEKNKKVANIIHMKFLASSLQQLSLSDFDTTSEYSKCILLAFTFNKNTTG